VDTAEFVRRRLSFQTLSGATATWGVDAWDTGELLTSRLSEDEVAFVDKTPNLVSGLPGMTVGGVVYHHGRASRTAGGSASPNGLEGWRDACAKLRAALVEPPPA
jgi:hypothetical protein